MASKRVHVQFYPDHVVRVVEVLKAQPLRFFAGTEADRGALLLLISTLEIAISRFDEKLPTTEKMIGILTRRRR